MRFVWVAIGVATGVAYSAGYTGARADERSTAAWEKMDGRREAAHSPAEFRVFQDRFPELFGGENPAEVTFAYVDHERYAFRGASVCAAGDPRLLQSVVTYGACFRGGEGGRCFESMARGLPDGDPCGT